MLQRLIVIVIARVIVIAIVIVIVIAIVVIVIIIVIVTVIVFYRLICLNPLGRDIFSVLFLFFFVIPPARRIVLTFYS